MKKILFCIVLAAGTFLAASAQSGRSFKLARELYKAGQWAEARSMFIESKAANEPVALSYAALCSARMRTSGYEQEIAECLDSYSWTGLAPEMHYVYGCNLFDEGKYGAALEQLSVVKPQQIARDERASYFFRKGWSLYATGDYASALDDFAKVEILPRSVYTAPAQFATGNIFYEKKQFEKAQEWFLKSRKDKRFEEMSDYYICECRFLLKDYDYVTEHGAALHDSVSDERKPHLARIISESWLVKGDVDKARIYYDSISGGERKSRGDWFYAGSLLYAAHDYPGAVENFSMMPDRTDSLGQIANYQLAYSYIQTRNKVAAMQAFKDAAALDFDKAIKEDAFFNHAKLAFDLNHDSSVFDKYIATYSDKAKGEQIYAYMAVAALRNHDFASAVDAYDKIEHLDNDMKANYMKANYLRARQLIDGGSWRSAAKCLRTAAYYSDRRTEFGQLSRYWLAEARFRDGLYDEARGTLKDLYNISALNGRPEGRAIPYTMGYTYFMEGDYKEASRWFDLYMEPGGKLENLSDALLRKADCAFIQRDYASAANIYDKAIATISDLSDLYPWYQSGISYGLSKNSAKKIERLSTVKKASPDARFYAESLYELGRAYSDAGKNADAASCYKSLMQSGADSSYIARALIGLGYISRNGGKHEDALAYYKQVVREMPGTSYCKDAMAAIESIYQSQSRPEEYVAFVESLTNGAADDIDPRTLLFNAAEQIFLSGNYEKAIVSLQSYIDKYPKGEGLSQAQFYMAESHRKLGRKDKACDWYRKVIDAGDESFTELSALNLARLSYEMQRYSDAVEGYGKLLEVARIPSNRHVARLGLMQSSFGWRKWDDAIAHAALLTEDGESTADELRLAKYITAKSHLAMSRRDEAMAILRPLSEEISTAEGAEAAYLMILDAYDRGDFENVEKLVYGLAEAGTSQTYWLAKSFITLGDSFVEREMFKQARATYESVRDGYIPAHGSDDVAGNIKMRLDKLSEMGK